MSGTPTGTIRTSRSARFATTDRYVTRIDPTLQYFISLSRHVLTQYPWCSFSQLDASKGKCFGCGKDGANTSLLLRSKLKKDAWYCQLCIMREVHISRFFILSLSLCPGNFVGMITSVTSCFVSTHVVRVPYFSQKLAIETAAGTTCVNCETDTTSGQWFNCKYTGTKLCTPCYNKNRLDVAAAAGTCVKSGTDTTVVSGTAAKTSPKVKFA